MGNAASRVFYEIRILTSLALLVFTLYKCRFIDALFKYLVRLDMERVTKLPVEIGSLTSSFSAGFVIIENIRINAPPVEIDDRWHIETMVSVACLYIEVPMFMALFFQIVSMSQLMVCDSIHVTGLKFFAEGHLGPNDVMQYNLDLIGGKRDTTVVDHSKKVKLALEEAKKERLRAKLEKEQELKRLKEEKQRRKSEEKTSLSTRTGINELGSGFASDTTLKGTSSVDMTPSAASNVDSANTSASVSCDSYELNFAKSLSSVSLHRRPSSATMESSSDHDVVMIRSKNSTNTIQRGDQDTQTSPPPLKMPDRIVIPSDVRFASSEEEEEQEEQASLAVSESCVTLISVPSGEHLTSQTTDTDFVYARTPSGNVNCEGSLLNNINSATTEITTATAAAIHEGSTKVTAALAASVVATADASSSLTVTSKSSGIFSFSKLIKKATVAFQEIQQDVAAHNEKVDHFWKTKVTEVSSQITNTVNEWKNDIDDFNENVSKKGLLGVATEKINEAIEKTRKSIEDSIDDNIIALHVKQNGLEPEIDPLEPRLICRKMVFDTIEVYMYRTLPLQLRHLEKKPLVVQSLVIDHIGYEGLKFHTRLPKQPTPVPSVDKNVGQTQTAASSESAEAEGDDEEDEELLDAWNTIRKHSQVVRSTTSKAKPQYREGVKVETVVTPVASERVNEGNSSSSGSSGGGSSARDRARSRSDSGKYDETKSVPPTAAVPSRRGMSTDNDPRIHEVMMRSIDASKSGLDINILKYRFERALLLDICKSNGGRLLMDVFDLTSWNTTPSYSNFTYLVNKNAVKKSPAASAANNVNVTPLKDGTKNAVHNEGVVEIHPIFFGEDE